MERTLKILLTLVSLVFAGNAIAQSPDTAFVRQDHRYDDTLIYAIDTVIFPSGMMKHMLFGTTELPNTEGLMGARGYGLWSYSVAKSECADTPEYHEMNICRINSVVNTDSTLVVDITITENCCHDFLCDIAVDTSGTLNLLYYGYGTYCACDCQFGLTYTFVKWGVRNDPQMVKDVMINGDRKTLKPVK